MKPVLLGAYRLIAKLGRGRVTDVYLAMRDARASKDDLVVVKRLRSGRNSGDESPPEEVSVGPEAELAPFLHHPSIATMHEVNQSGSAPFWVMEYIEGQPLDRVLATANRSGGLPVSFGLRMLCDLLSALDYAHNLSDDEGKPRGIVHRDVRPHNIFISYQGELKLLDFGVPRPPVARADSSTSGESGRAYLAPEQAFSGSVDRRADVFAVGLVMWELLTKQRRATGEVPVATLQGLQPEITTEQGSLDSELREELSRINNRALERQPDERYATAEEMRSDLEAALVRLADPRCATQAMARANIGNLMQRLFKNERSDAARRVQLLLAVDTVSGPERPADALVQAATATNGSRPPPLRLSQTDEMFGGAAKPRPSMPPLPRRDAAQSSSPARGSGENADLGAPSDGARTSREALDERPSRAGLRRDEGSEAWTRSGDARASRDGEPSDERASRAGLHRDDGSLVQAPSDGARTSRDALDERPSRAVLRRDEGSEAWTRGGDARASRDGDALDEGPSRASLRRDDGSEARSRREGLEETGSRGLSLGARASAGESTRDRRAVQRLDTTDPRLSGVAPAPERRAKSEGRAFAAFAAVLLVLGAVALTWSFTQRPSTQETKTAAAVAAPEPPVKPVLRLCGSNTVGAELAPALVEALFSNKDSGAKVTHKRNIDSDVTQLVSRSDDKALSAEITARGTATGFAGLADGSCDVGMASRPISADEAILLHNKGLGDLSSPANEHVVALDGVAVVVHPNNPLHALDRKALHDIFTGKATDWSDVGGPAGPIHVSARDDQSGTYDTFHHLVLGEDKLVSSAKRYARSDALADAVASDPAAIGFVGLAYVRTAKALAVGEAGAAPLLPTQFTVATEGYMLSRRLYFYTPDKPSSPWVTELVSFAMSQRGQEIAGKAGFVNLSLLTESTRCTGTCPARYLATVDKAQRISVDLRFRSGSNQPDSRARRDMDRLVSFLQNFREAKVLLLGFSDSVGSVNSNLRLSEGRAKAIADELAMRGIHASVVTGFGAEMPVATNETESGRERNRRVEVWFEHL